MDKNFLIELLKTDSPSGYESKAIKVFNEYCELNGAKHEFTDKMGNSCYSIGNGPLKVMVSGHIDELGLQVQGITNEGFIQFVRLGGIDKKVLPGSRVSILTDSGELFGIIGKKPIHVESPDERNSVDKIKDLLIDVGVTDSKDVESLKNIVKTGDPIIILGDPIEMNFNNNVIVSKGLDDKVGVFISTQVLNYLKDEKDLLNKITLYIVANTQEEVGLRGAVVTSKRINPDISIDIDVTFATDEGRGINTAEHGEVKLSKGVVIQHGPDKSKRINKIMRSVSKEMNIPTQEISSDCGGTNTAAIQEHAFDCETTLISIPNRNMHTQVECCDYRDINSAIKLISETIKRLV